MRRPAPLPNPPAPPRDEAPAVDPTALLVPFGTPASRPVPDATSASPAPAAPVAPEPETPMGLRDVWRASRARRRALRAEVRRFTVRQRRRRMLWLGAAGALVLLVLGTVGAAYSPLFAVERIEVVGTTTLDANAVAQALGGQQGTPLALVDSSAVKAALVQFPLVESYTIEARPPHDLVVRIVERTPVGVLSSAAGYTVVDAAGVALSTTPDPPAGQPTLKITGGTSSPAFRAAGTVVRSLPADIRAQVTEVTASTPDDVTLTLGGANASVVWGDAEHSAQKALNLARMMQSRPPADVSTYDVSSPDVVVVR